MVGKEWQCPGSPLAYETRGDSREEVGVDQREPLGELIEALPSKLQEEVRGFVMSLVEKQGKRPRRKPRFNWAGALRELGKQYTSVELQHKISEWRIGPR